MNEEKKAMLEREFRKDKLKKIAIGAAVVIGIIIFSLFVLAGVPEISNKLKG